MKKSLFIGQKVKDEGSKVLFVGVFMFVGNGFSNEKPQISTGRFCSLRCALYSVICSLLSVLCTLILPLVLLAIVAGSLFYPFFCRSKEPKPPSHERYSRPCLCSGVAPVGCNILQSAMACRSSLNAPYLGSQELACGSNILRPCPKRR